MFEEHDEVERVKGEGGAEAQRGGGGGPTLRALQVTGSTLGAIRRLGWRTAWSEVF